MDQKLTQNALSEQLSSLIDGELNAEQTRALLAELQASPDTSALFDKFDAFQHISAHIQSPSSAYNPHFSTRVMNAIEAGAPLTHPDTDTVRPINTNRTLHTQPTSHKRGWLPSFAAAACFFIAMITSTYWYFESPNTSSPTATISAYQDNTGFQDSTAFQDSTGFQDNTPLIPVENPVLPKPASKTRPSLEDFAKLAAEDRARFNQYYMMHTGSAMMVGPSHAVTLARVVDLEPNTTSNLIPVNHSQ